MARRRRMTMADWVEDGSDDDEGDAAPPPPPPPMDDADIDDRLQRWRPISAAAAAISAACRRTAAAASRQSTAAARRATAPAGNLESMLCTRIIMPVESLTTLSRKHGGCRCAIFFPTPGTKPRTNASHYCVCEETGRKSSQTQPSCCCDGSRNARPSSRRARRASSVHEFLGTSLCHLALRTPCWASAARSTWTHCAPFTRT